ncbi:DNA topoisomerase IV [Flavobacterium sp.]|uniref:DNA topoisomerase IV n=1 Tax=Flavobacterium sp. TaxID=239 RepID=UPI002A80FF43|nr:DNA topoisomerase IV [Flavobacterium sp.]
MEINKYLFVFIPFLMTSCYEQERNCSDFKTGTFESEIIIDEVKHTSTFERNDSIQIETYKGVTDTFNIRWINDCEYIIKNSNPKNMAEKKSVSMKILTTKDNTYFFEYNYVGDTNKHKGTVTKL